LGPWLALRGDERDPDRHARSVATIPPVPCAIIGRLDGAHGPSPLRPADAPARPAGAGGPPPLGLQPVLDVAPARPGALRPDRLGRLAASPLPDPRPRRHGRLGPPPRRPRLHGRGPSRHRRLRSLPRERLGPLVPPPPREAARRPDRLLLRRVRPPRVA